MPEGDTIFRSARALRQALAGHKILRFDTGYAHLASANDQNPVAGRTVEQVEARGKWLLVYFSGDLILTTHMLMSGSWHIYRPGERWKRPRSHMRILLETDTMVAVAFDVPIARFHTARSLERFTAVTGLGPDVLGQSFAADEASQRLLSHGNEEIGDVLLNQRVMAGIGNVFKSEICFACQVNPFRKVATLEPKEIACLLDTARRFLAANVTETARDGIVTYTGLRRTTGSSNPAERLWVYRRAGEECRRCGTKILTRKQGVGARSTFWCPECQVFREAARPAAT
jgi:endonuclease VIII